MKKFGSILVLCCLSIIGIYAQTTEKRNVGSFNGIDVCCGIKVLLTQGSSSSVEVEAKSENIQYVKTEVKGNTLYITFDNKKKCDKKGSITVYVTANDIKKLEANSAGIIEGTNTIHARNIKLDVNSAGLIKLDMKADNVVCKGNSAGKITLKGEAQALTADNNSAASFDLKGLEAVKADVSSNSAASIDLNVKTEVNANANSGARIRYYGNPSLTNVASNSGGSVKKAK